MLDATRVKRAINAAECIDIDYGDRTEEEINALDNALDTVFKATKAYAEIMENYKEVKVVTAEELKNEAVQ